MVQIPDDHGRISNTSTLAAQISPSTLRLSRKANFQKLLEHSFGNFCRKEVKGDTPVSGRLPRKDVHPFEA